MDAQLRFKRNALAITLLLNAALCFGSVSESSCQQRIEMAGYSVCFPRTWRVYRNPSRGTVSGCNKTEGDCTGTGGGFPLPGVEFVFLFPAERGPGHSQHKSAHEIAANTPQASPPVVTEVSLTPDGATQDRQCWVSRSLMFGKVWNEVYGLSVGTMLFRASAQYNNEPSKLQGYREAIREILSSVSVRNKTSPSK
jgi:hypothetical protein